MASDRQLEFAKIAVLVIDLYLHAILHLRSKFCINRPIWLKDMAKNDFQLN